MHAKALEFVVYESHWKWHAERVFLPTWPQIDSAIRLLDKFHYPFLHLWPTLDESQHELVEDREWFTIIGGNGEYWFAATIAGQWENHYIDKTGGNQEIQLWTSDQGFAAPEKEVCRDIEIVLHAARHYAENGTYDPTVSWSSELPKGESA